MSTRDLITDIQVRAFVTEILQIKGKEECQEAINKIAEAERNMQNYAQVPTLTHKDNRDTEYVSDEKREELRKAIFNELKDKKRLKNEDKIKLKSGGAKPREALRQERKMFYVIGSTASGKSTIANQLADLTGSYLLDADYAKRKLPEYDNQIGAASLVHEESDALVFSYENYNLLEYCVNNGYNMVIPKIGYKSDGIIKFAERLNEKAYTSYLVSIDLDRVKTTQRAYNRFVQTGRYVPLSLVFDTYSNEPTLNYFRIKQRARETFNGYAQISTDVPLNEKAKLIEVCGDKEFQQVFRRLFVC